MSDITVPQSFEDKMKARIKDSIGDLITDEELKKLVDKSMHEVFFAEKTVKDGWNTRTVPPFLNQIVRELLNERVREAVALYIKEHPQEVLKAVDDALKDGVGMAIVNAVTSYFNNHLYTFQQNIANQLATRP